MTSCCGCDINMDGTRYWLLHEAADDGQRHSKLNFSMIATRLSAVSCWSKKDPKHAATAFLQDALCLKLVQQFFEFSFLEVIRLNSYYHLKNVDQPLMV